MIIIIIINNLLQITLAAILFLSTSCLILMGKFTLFVYFFGGTRDIGMSNAAGRLMLSTFSYDSQIITSKVKFC